MLNVLKGICGFIAIMCAVAIALEVSEIFVAGLFFTGIYAYIDFNQRKNKGERL